MDNSNPYQAPSNAASTGKGIRTSPFLVMAGAGPVAALFVAGFASMLPEYQHDYEYPTTRTLTIDFVMLGFAAWWLASLVICIAFAFGRTTRRFGLVVLVLNTVSVLPLFAHELLVLIGIRK